MPTFDEYINHVENVNVRQPLVKLELLRAVDESPIKEIVTQLRLEGSLNIGNSNGVRRTLNLSLDNTLRDFFPSLDSGIFVGQKARLSLGYIINGEEYFIRQGTFVHERPRVGSDNSVGLSMVDKFSLLDGSISGIIDTILIIPTSTTLGNAIRSIMTISQDTQDVLIDSDIDSLVIPYQLIKEEGSTLGELLIELANAFSCNVYYNENGNLVFEQDKADSTKGSIWDFDADSIYEKNYIDGDIQYNFDNVKNSITVIGDNINGAIYRANVKNEDLLSDTSIPNLGIEILEVITDDIIYSNALCEQRAIYELKRKTNVVIEGRVESIILPHLDVDRVITLSSNRLNLTKKRLLINSITMPLDNQSSMSISIADTFDIDL